MPQIHLARMLVAVSADTLGLCTSSAAAFGAAVDEGRGQTPSPNTCIGQQGAPEVRPQFKGFSMAL